jgi:probable HAF family extracellular repeat protein
LFTTLDVSDASFTFPYGINGSGKIVGAFDGHGFLKDSGGYNTLDVDVPGAHTEAHGINDSGQIVGTYDDAFGRAGFLKDGGDYTKLYGASTWLDTSPYGINDSGQIVGFYLDIIDGHDHGFLWKGGDYTTFDVNVPGAYDTKAYGINNYGQIVGSYLDASNVEHGFLKDRSGYTTLDVPGAGFTRAYGINDSGQIVGECGSPFGPIHGFLKDGGNYTTLDVLGLPNTYVYGINDSGQIVGWSDAPGVGGFLAAPGPVPKTVQPDPANPGGLVVTYDLPERLPAGETVPVSVYWATGPQGSDALSVNAPHGQAKSPGDALYTYMVDSSEGPGTHTFDVGLDKLLTAPHGAMDLLVVTDPKDTLSGQGAKNAILPVVAYVGLLSAPILQKLMPGLSAADAGRYAPLLTSEMGTYGIRSLEQEAMFLGQLAVESGNLTQWVEERSKSSCIDLYWTHRFNQWAGTGTAASATVYSSGIVLSVPASGNNPPAKKAFDLKWAVGSVKAPTSSAARAAATKFSTVQFTKVGNRYTYTFTGAVPPDTGAQFPHLIVVDTASHKVVTDLVNRLGNWSPNDAFEFRGGGPIQLTGRHNYQLFADYEGAAAASLMTTHNGKSPAEQLGDQNNPQLGFDAAGYFWEFLAGNLNTKTDGFAWQPTAPFNLAISKAINNPSGAPNGLAQRLQNYLRIRAVLLGPYL